MTSLEHITDAPALRDVSLSPLAIEHRYRSAMVCLKRLSSLTGWNVSRGDFVPFAIFLGFNTSFSPFAIYF